MIVVGTFSAKTHLSSLLDRVAAGEEVVITKHRRVVAKLVGAGDADQTRLDDAVAALKRLRRGTLSARLSWTALRDEGRR